MTRYILVSSTFEGFIKYGYHKTGFLLQFENCSIGMTEDQLQGVCLSLKHALSHDNFVAWANDRGYKTIKVQADLSFDRFWRTFDNARNRIQAEKLWKAMNEEQRQYAFYVHEAYEYWLSENTWATKMYPDTFLRGHLRDEYYKVQKAPQKPKP